MSLKRFGVSLEDNLLESLDQYVNENGFANRSQAIRFLIEKNVAERKWQCNHIVAGTIVIMYDQVKKEISLKIMGIQQNYKDVILSSSQYYIGDEPGGLMLFFEGLVTRFLADVPLRDV